MKRKKIFLITGAAVSAVLLTAGLVLLFVNKSVRKYKPPPRVTVSFPEEGGSAPAFREYLVKQGRDDVGLYIYEEIIPTNEYLKKMSDRLSDPISGDLFYMINNAQIRFFGRSGLLSDLSDMEKDFSKAGVDEWFFSLGKADNDALVYLPVSWYPWGFYYRISFFEESGLEEPETWDEFITVCETLKRNNRNPVTLVSSEKWPLLIWFDYLDVRVNGPDYHRDFIDLKIPFDDKGLFAVFKIINELVKEGYIVVDQESEDWTGQLKALEKGTAVMALSGSFFYDKFNPEMKSDLGWFPFPVVNEFPVKGEIVSSSGFILSREGPKQINAGTLLLYAVSEDFQSRLFENTGMLPVNGKVTADMNRTDINDAYGMFTDDDQLFALTERNGYPSVIIPLKMQLNKLIYVSSDEEIYVLLAELEKLRTDLLKQMNKDS